MLHRLLVTGVVAAAFSTAVPAAGVSLPVVPDGVRVAGVDVGGLISPSARARVASAFNQPIRLFHRDTIWSVSPARLGARASINEAVKRALRAAPGSEIALRVDVQRRAVRRYVASLNRRFAVPATNAELLGLSDSDLAPSFSEPKAGRRVDEPTMVRRLVRALRSPWRGGQIELQLVPVPPSTTADDYGSIVVIRRGSNRLYLYDGPSLIQTFAVATGQAQYPTPLGTFEIIVKERNPTWNPPDSEWAEGLEPVPPGPGNPLGTRWMGISSPAVGIHGTPDAASLGYSVSHGCIRMAIPDAEWLFEQVEVGTPVYIVSA